MPQIYRFHFLPVWMLRRKWSREKWICWFFRREAGSNLRVESGVDFWWIGMRGRKSRRDASATLGAGGGFAAPDYFAVYDCGHWGALEFAAIEWGVLGFAGGIFGAEGPFVICGENC